MNFLNNYFGNLNKFRLPICGLLFFLFGLGIARQLKGNQFPVFWGELI